MTNKRSQEDLLTSRAVTPSKIVSEYDQEKPQSQTSDKPVEPLGRATHQSPDTRKTN